MERQKPEWHFVEVPAADININRLYQRDSNKRAVNKIISEFDYHHVNPAKVVFRDGEYYAFDGQHTVLALRALFGNDFRVPCLIYNDIPTWCDEATLFETCNSTAKGKKVSETELWKSRLNRGEPVSTKIVEICSRNGAKVNIRGGSTNTNCIRALHALENIYNSIGETKFEQVIKIIVDAWNCEQYSCCSEMLKGMAKFVEVYYGKYDYKTLIRKLQKQPPLSIIRAGKASVVPGAEKYAREILNIYNNHLSESRRLVENF